MKSRNLALSGLCLAVASFIPLAGCEYEEDDVHSQAEPENKMIEQSKQRSSSGSSYGNDSYGASLGAAKRSAKGVIAGAEQHSQNVANQADELSKPDR